MKFIVAWRWCHPARTRRLRCKWSGIPQNFFRAVRGAPIPVWDSSVLRSDFCVYGNLGTENSSTYATSILRPLPTAHCPPTKWDLPIAHWVCPYSIIFSTSGLPTGWEIYRSCPYSVEGSGIPIFLGGQGIWTFPKRGKFVAFPKKGKIFYIANIRRNLQILYNILFILWELLL